MEVDAVELPMQIAFRYMERSEAVEDLIRESSDRLDRFADQVLSCRVVVEAPHGHQEHGNPYRVRIDLTVPGEEIVVNREPLQRTEHRDLGVALRDAFDAARRQLEDYLRCRRGHVKSHEGEPHARIARLFPEEGYGFLATPDGRELYFHRNSVLNGGFDRLEVGTEVTFTEGEGKKGPQASTVKRVGRHHHL
jgi:cold shock CspA family protein/ribosome-associated translation inhibitor RaiA